MKWKKLSWRTAGANGTLSGPGENDRHVREVTDRAENQASTTLVRGPRQARRCVSGDHAKVHEDVRQTVHRDERAFPFGCTQRQASAWVRSAGSGRCLLPRLSVRDHEDVAQVLKALSTCHGLHCLPAACKTHDHQQSNQTRVHVTRATEVEFKKRRQTVHKLDIPGKNQRAQPIRQLLLFLGKNPLPPFGRFLLALRPLRKAALQMHTHVLMYVNTNTPPGPKDS